MAETKKTTKRKTTATAAETSEPVIVSSSLLSKASKTQDDIFVHLSETITKAKEEFVDLQKDIIETKSAWEKEQREHDVAIADRNKQEDLTRKREEEVYEYETTFKRKRAEDEFTERKMKWEKDLASQKEEIEKEREELLVLRKQVEGFESEKQKAVKEASASLEKELTSQYATEKKLREQEFKSEKEILALKLTSLTQENSRQTKDIDEFKKALDETTKQLKDVAIKVIEQGNQNQKPLFQQQEG